MARFKTSFWAISGGLLSLLLCTSSSLWALDYVESSQGLDNPQWEGGRTEIEMADLNLDGNLELISIGDHGNPFINTEEHGVMVYFWNTTGRWVVYQNGNFGYGGICVGDANNDGLPDIGYAMHHDYSSTDFGDQLIEVALGDGTGQNWTPWDDNLASAGETYGMFATDFGDVDNDGDLDIVATSFGAGNPLQVYLNDGDGSWTHSQAVTPGPNNNMYVSFGDINRDGNLDLVSSYSSGSVFFGLGNGQFVNAEYNLPPGSTYGHNGICLGDVDNDGGLDIAYTYDGGVLVWTWNETTSLWEEFSTGLPTTGSYAVAQLADLNADGFCDVAAAGSGRVTVWTGDGAGNWAMAASYVIQNDPDCYFEAFRVGGDVDHNGYPDLVHLTDEGSWINSYNHLRNYKESSIAQTLSILPLYPKGGEVFQSGSVRFVDWSSAVPGAATSSVMIELSTTGSAGPWTTVGQNLPNNGRFQWTVPTISTSSNCYLRLTVTSGTTTATATIPAPFTIMGGAPNVQITLDPVNPPIVIPPSGGSFNYLISVINSESQPVTCSAWITATLPSGGTYGPILNVPLSVPVGALSRNRVQNVPGNAPAGSYTYNAYIGIYPNTTWSSDSFPFTKSGSGFWGLGSGDWSSSGDSFDPTAILGSASSLPTSLDFTVCPNPFNPSTAASFELRAASYVSLMVYDTAGRLVVTLVEGWREAGVHRVTFEGSGLPSGMYLVRLTPGQTSQTQKVVLLK